MRILSIILVFVGVALTTSCQTTGGYDGPPREKLSSIPHNQPASWEGQGGMGGFQNQY